MKFNQSKIAWLLHLCKHWLRLKFVLTIGNCVLRCQVSVSQMYSEKIWQGIVPPVCSLWIAQSVIYCSEDIALLVEYFFMPDALCSFPPLYEKEEVEARETKVCIVLGPYETVEKNREGRRIEKHENLLLIYFYFSIEKLDFSTALLYPIFVKSLAVFE